MVSLACPSCGSAQLVQLDGDAEAEVQAVHCERCGHLLLHQHGLFDRKSKTDGAPTSPRAPLTPRPPPLGAGLFETPGAASRARDAGRPRVAHLLTPREVDVGTPRAAPETPGQRVQRAGIGVGLCTPLTPRAAREQRLADEASATVDERCLRLFNECDRGGHGKLGYKELCAALRRMRDEAGLGGRPSPAVLERAWDAADADGSHAVDYAEFSEWHRATEARIAAAVRHQEARERRARESAAGEAMAGLQAGLERADDAAATEMILQLVKYDEGAQGGEMQRRLEARQWAIDNPEAAASRAQLAALLQTATAVRAQARLGLPHRVRLYTCPARGSSRPPTCPRLALGLPFTCPIWQVGKRDFPPFNEHELEVLAGAWMRALEEVEPVQARYGIDNARASAAAYARFLGAVCGVRSAFVCDRSFRAALRSNNAFDGTLSFWQVEQALRPLKSARLDDRAAYVFDMYDVASEGKLSLSQINDMINGAAQGAGATRAEGAAHPDAPAEGAAQPCDCACDADLLSLAALLRSLRSHEHRLQVPHNKLTTPFIHTLPQ